MEKKKQHILIPRLKPKLSLGLLHPRRRHNRLPRPQLACHPQSMGKHTRPRRRQPQYKGHLLPSIPLL